MMQAIAITEDLIILPLVLTASVVKRLFKVALSTLIRILDFAFPILLQLARFPLFTARITGDAFTAFLQGVVRWLPISSTKREQWRGIVRRHWSWVRQYISYKTFEEAVHRAFENGMAWVFRKCRTLTPSSALLVIAGAILWLPVSFGAATAMHAVLIAKATALPAWMQLLHPLATIIAKSKLLVLPVYPAAWPQAKKHPFVEKVVRYLRHLARLRLVRKTRYRYRQTELWLARAVNAVTGSVPFVRVMRSSNPLLSRANTVATWIGKGLRARTMHLLKTLARVPLIGAVVNSYLDQYGNTDLRREAPLSERMSGFFERWSIKFSAEYYEARERDKLPRRNPC
jgi:hypothetical protein